MLLQLWAELPGLGEVELIASPPLEEAARRLNDQSGPFPGNASYGFGGAILAPYANRIRGRQVNDVIETQVGDLMVRLPANCSGKAPGAERYAMHGLILDTPAPALRLKADEVFGIAHMEAGGAWPSDLDIEIEWRLSPTRLELCVLARNTGDVAAPVGLGWHPYVKLPSGRRDQARLHVPSSLRALVDNYDAVLPTGRVATVTNSPYDFSMTGGRILGELYLDDCFLEPKRDANGEIVVDVIDPAANLCFRFASPSPQIRAIQVYAPPDEAFVVIEPQFNLADPFGAEWGSRDTGMVWLQAQESTIYQTSIEILDAPV
jgi:aldose 1-epimerase